MKRAYRLARLLLIRLKEIDPSKGGPYDQSPDGDTYNLLIDAVMDEIGEVCPDVYAEVAGKGTWDWKLKLVGRT